MDVFFKETLLKGRPVRARCLEIGGQTYALTRGPTTVVQLEDPWYEDVEDPESAVAALRSSSIKADLFTFWQRLPDTQPRFDFHLEWDSIAALPVRSFDHWWNRQIKARTRNLIRKSEKGGIQVREASYDDEFVRGMTAIFNETAVRQGRRFWHYGKDFDTVKRQFSRYLFREDLIGAYYRDELIGFLMLGNARRYAVTGQIISKVAYRSKATNNALIAKAVEVCERRELPYLVYLHWGNGSLTEFKRRCGFTEIRVPRYYVPLSWVGMCALRLGLHRGWKEAVPGPVKDRLKDLRSWWLSRRERRKGDPCPVSPD